MAGNASGIVDIKDMVDRLTEELVLSHRESEALLQAVDELRSRVASLLQFQRISLQLLPWLSGLQENLARNAGSALAVMTSEEDILYVTSRSEEFDKMGMSVLEALSQASKRNAAAVRLGSSHVQRPVLEAGGGMAASLEEISRLFFKNETVISQLRAACDAAREVEMRLEGSSSSSSISSSSAISSSSSSSSSRNQTDWLVTRAGERSEASQIPRRHLGSATTTNADVVNAAYDSSTAKAAAATATSSSSSSWSSTPSLVSSLAAARGRGVRRQEEEEPGQQQQSGQPGQEKDLGMEDFLDTHPVRRHTTFAPGLTSGKGLDLKDLSSRSKTSVKGVVDMIGDKEKIEDDVKTQGSPSISDCNYVDTTSDDEFITKPPSAHSIEASGTKRRRPFRPSDEHVRSIKPKPLQLEISD